MLQHTLLTTESFGQNNVSEGQNSNSEFVYELGVLMVQPTYSVKMQLLKLM
jgi:hypothetical protein